MKSIIIKNKPNLGHDIINAEVEEETLNFINDLSVAKVKVTYSNQYSRNKFCIINKKYEEAFIYDNEKDSAKFLTLSNENMNIERVTENDFIVTSLHSNGSHCTKKISHIKIEDNIPKLINDDLYKTEVTKCPNIIISDGQLYDVKKGLFVSRKYHHIEELLSDNKYHRFFVNDKLKIDNNFTEYLSFVIDINDRIISPIYSEIELDLYIEEIPKLEYEKIKEQRLLELNKKRTKSNEIIKKLRKTM